MGEVVWLDEGVEEGEICGLSGDYCVIQGRGGGGSCSVVDLMNMVSGRTTTPLLSSSPVS